MEKLTKQDIAANTIELEAVYINGRLRCLYLGKYRVYGGKPWEAAGPKTEFIIQLEKKELKEALRREGYALVRLEGAEERMAEAIEDAHEEETSKSVPGGGR